MASAGQSPTTPPAPVTPAVPHTPSYPTYSDSLTPPASLSPAMPTAPSLSPVMPPAPPQDAPIPVSGPTLPPLPTTPKPLQPAAHVSRPLGESSLSKPVEVKHETPALDLDEPEIASDPEHQVFIPAGTEIEGSIKTDRPLIIHGRVGGAGHAQARHRRARDRRGPEEITTRTLG